MIRKILFLLPIVAVIFATSCKKEDTPQPFSISPQDIVLSAAGDSSYVSVYGVDERWEMHFGKQGSDAICSFNSTFTEFAKTGQGRTEAIKFYSKPNMQRENKYDTLYLQDLSGKYGIIKVKLTLSAESIIFKTLNNDSVFYVPQVGKEMKIKLQTNVDKIDFTSVPSGWIYSENKVDSTVSFTIPENNSIRVSTNEIVMNGSWNEPKRTRKITLFFIQDGTTNIKTDSVALTYLNSTFNLGWDQSKPVSTWSGIEVAPIDNSEGVVNRVTGINLSKKSLTGTIPAKIAELPYLRALRLDGNKLTGSIPDSYYELVNLQTLWLGNNPLNGVLKGEISNLKKLRNLSIINTSISGEIPASIGELKELSSLELNDNEFSGTLPTKLGENKLLLVFTVSNNHLTGDVPATYKSNVNWYYWNPTVNIFPQRDGVILK